MLSAFLRLLSDIPVEKETEKHSWEKFGKKKVGVIVLTLYHVGRASSNVPSEKIDYISCAESLKFPYWLMKLIALK